MRQTHTQHIYFQNVMYEDLSTVVKSKFDLFLVLFSLRMNLDPPLECHVPLNLDGCLSCHIYGHIEIVTYNRRYIYGHIEMATYNRRYIQ